MRYTLCMYDIFFCFYYRQEIQKHKKLPYVKFLEKLFKIALFKLIRYGVLQF